MRLYCLKRAIRLFWHFFLLPIWGMSACILFPFDQAGMRWLP